MKIEERVKILEDRFEKKKRELREANIFVWGIVTGVALTTIMVIIEVYL